MTPEHFALWLQGFAELNSQPPTPEQWQSIREHLATVFDKRTPDMIGERLKKIDGHLDAAEDGLEKAKGQSPRPWPLEGKRDRDAALFERIRRQEQEENPYRLGEHVRIIC